MPFVALFGFVKLCGDFTSIQRVVYFSCVILYTDVYFVVLFWVCTFVKIEIECRK